MIRYHHLGELPEKKHTAFKGQNGEFYWEQLFSTEGFAGVYSTKYHMHLPTSVEAIRELAYAPEVKADVPLQAIHFKTNQGGRGNYIQGRQVMLFNEFLKFSVCQPSEKSELFFKNAHAHELFFVHEGEGVLESEYGKLKFRPGDYVVIPKGTIYQFQYRHLKKNRLILIESKSPFQLPAEFKNEYGQILEHAPYCERDFRLPEFMEAKNEKGLFELVIQNRDRQVLYELDHHPFDVVGWDGYVYPFAFNIADYAPHVGKLHLPPSVHKVFENENFMVTNFVPRLMDFHDQAIPVPYYHFNCDCDEILYYMKGDFMSRKGIGEGSVTLHPMGIPHGPQPGKIENSLGMKEVDEWAVMIDVFSSIYLTEQSKKALDQNYFKSWSS